MEVGNAPGARQGRGDPGRRGSGFWSGGLEDSPQLALKGWGWGDWQMVDVRAEKDAVSAVIHKLPVFTAV